MNILFEFSLFCLIQVHFCRLKKTKGKIKVKGDKKLLYALSFHSHSFSTFSFTIVIFILSAPIGICALQVPIGIWVFHSSFN